MIYCNRVVVTIFTLSIIVEVYGLVAKLQISTKLHVEFTDQTKKFRYKTKLTITQSKN